MTPSDWEFRFDSTFLPDLYAVTVLEVVAVCPGRGAGGADALDRVGIEGEFMREVSG